MADSHDGVGSFTGIASTHTICERCKRPTGPLCPCLTVEFSGGGDPVEGLGLAAPAVVQPWRGVDGYGVTGDFAPSQLLAWLRWHLDRGRVVHLAVQILEASTDRKAANRL